MTIDARLIAEARESHARVSRCLLDARKLVDEEFGRQRSWTGASAAAERDARERLHRLGCLSLALDALMERIDEREQSPGGRPALARLLAEPCVVRFTANTGEPAHDEALTVVGIVAAAREQSDRIGDLVAGHRSAASSVAARLARLRTDFEELAARTGPGRADGDRTGDDGTGPGDGPAGRLAALQRQAAADPLGCARPGPWRDAVNRAADEVAVLRRARAAAAEQDLTARAERLRTAVRRWRHLVTEATREGLGDGTDPVVGLPVDALLDRVGHGVPSGPDAQAVLGEELDRTTERVDAARRRLRRRCHAELGGRLEAYRQRAADEGRAEHPELDRHYREARDRLRPDGFAVTAASRAVRAYQQAVNEGTR
ncbi:hypothetical protein ACFO0M_28050 [Micromonospora mangrovi]|uniref:CHAD domain-containing protein n=2 Tax=Micromonospora TaxID=1873 RepID=A0AAU7ME68_9ACTN